MFISQVHTHTLSLILKLIQNPWQMEIHQIHQSGVHTYTHTHTHTHTHTRRHAHRQTHTHTYTHTLSSVLMIIQTPQQMEIHHSHQSGTYTYTLFITQDNTDATADEYTSCSSVRQTHTHTLCLLHLTIQTPRQMEIQHVHQSGVHTHIHSLFNTQDSTDAIADGDTSCSSVRLTQTHSQTHTQTHTHTHLHTYTLVNTHDNTDATADGDTSCSSVRYIHIHSL